MADLNLTLKTELAGKTKEELLVIIDQEVDRFSKWMATLADERARGALNNPERALIKTYLVQKLTGKLDEVE